LHFISGFLLVLKNFTISNS